MRRDTSARVDSRQRGAAGPPPQAHGEPVSQATAALVDAQLASSLCRHGRWSVEREKGAGGQEVKLRDVLKIC